MPPRQNESAGSDIQLQGVSCFNVEAGTPLPATPVYETENGVAKGIRAVSQDARCGPAIPDVQSIAVDAERAAAATQWIHFW